MANGRSKALWGHTSSVLAMIANVNRDPRKTQAFKPSDFNPVAESAKKDTVIPKVNMKDLKNLIPELVKLETQRVGAKKK